MKVPPADRNDPKIYMSLIKVNIPFPQDKHVNYRGETTLIRHYNKRTKVDIFAHCPWGGEVESPVPRTRDRTSLPRARRAA